MPPGGGVHPIAFVRTAELKALDNQFEILRQIAPKDVERDVVVIGIDEETTKVFREPYTLWHVHFGRLFEALAIVDPVVVGVDINFPDRSYDFLLPGYDKYLLRGILALKSTAPLVLGVTVEADGRERPIYPPFLSVAGKNSAGFVQWRLDSDRVARHFTERLGEAGEELPTLVGTMARHMGLNPGEGIINYAVGKRFDYILLHQVLEWFEAADSKSLREAFADRPVLLGTVMPFEDRHYQPLNLAAWEKNAKFAPGVLIHAQALRSIMADGLVKRTPLSVVLAMTLVASLLWWGRAHWAARVFFGLAWTAILFALSTWLLDSGWSLPVVGIALAGIIACVGRALFELASEALDRQRLRRAFSGYVSPHIMEEILDGSLQAGLHGKRQRICVMFSDIRGFTRRSESMEPEDVISMLERYFERMTDAIQSRSGTLDKFMGDGIMAFFGAPKELDDPCQRAFEVAKDMIGRLDDLNQELASEGLPPLAIGIGLHIGEVVVGHVGSQARHEYTAIGDAVNVASRIEGLTKELGCPILFSEETLHELGDVEDVVDLGEQSVKGRQTAIRLFGWSASESSELKSNVIA